MKPIILCGEARGKNEDRIAAGFVGASGIELLRILDEASIISLTAEDKSYISRYYDTGDPTHVDMVWRMHPECYRTNVFQQHPPGDKIEAFCGPKSEALRGYPSLIKGKHIRSEFASELARLGDEILAQDPNLIVALGNTAFWALCGKTGVGKSRGTTFLSTHTVSGYKVLPTYHPAAVLRQWELRPVTVADMMKANREKEFSEIRRPQREIWIEPTLTDLEEFYVRFIQGCTCLSTDIETSGNRITCIGFSPKPNIALVIPFDDTRRKDRSYWKSGQEESDAWAFVRRILQDRSIPKLFQNGLYDIAFLWRAYGIKTYGAHDDTMLLHHALQPESLKGLGFLGSIYTDEGSWKQERKLSSTIKRDE